MTDKYSMRIKPSMGREMQKKCRVCDSVMENDIFPECDKCFKALIRQLIPNLG